MLHPPNKAAAGDPIVRAQAGNISESTPSSSRKTWRFWSGACFVIVLLAAFGQPLLGLANYAARSSLHSYILLIPFVSGYLLYLRRDQLPKERVADLPFGIALLACGLGVFLFTHWLAFAGRAAHGQLQLRAFDHLVPLLSWCGRFFLFRARLDASSRFSASLPHFHGSNAGCDGRCSRECFEICLGGGGKCSFSPQWHAFSPRRSRFPTAEHYHRSRAGMQRHSIELGAFDDWYPGRQFIPENVLAAFCACRIHHSARDFTKWLPHPRDRPPLRESRPADDSQSNPPPGRACVFRAFADSVIFAVVVAPQGRDPNPPSGIALRHCRGFETSATLFCGACSLCSPHFYASFRELCPPVSGERFRDPTLRLAPRERFA